MNDKTLKQFIRDLMEPVLDSLVNNTFNVYKGVVDNFPEDMTEAQVNETLEAILKTHSDNLIASINAAMPSKEEINNGK